MLLRPYRLVDEEGGTSPNHTRRPAAEPLGSLLGVGADLLDLSAREDGKDVHSPLAEYNRVGVHFQVVAVG